MWTRSNTPKRAVCAFHEISKFIFREAEKLSSEGNQYAGFNIRKDAVQMFIRLTSFTGSIENR